MRPFGTSLRDVLADCGIWGSKINRTMTLELTCRPAYTPSLPGQYHRRKPALISCEIGRAGAAPGCVATYLVATNPGRSLDDHLFSSLISAHGQSIAPYPFYQDSLLSVLNEIPNRMAKRRSFDPLFASFRGALGTRDPSIMRDSRRFAWTTPIAMPIRHQFREPSTPRVFCGR